MQSAIHHTAEEVHAPVFIRGTDSERNGAAEAIMVISTERGHLVNAGGRAFRQRQWRNPPIATEVQVNPLSAEVEHQKIARSQKPTQQRQHVEMLTGNGQFLYITGNLVTMELPAIQKNR